MLNEIAKRHFARLNSKKFHLDSFFLTENRPHKIFESEASVSTESKKVLLLCQIWFSVKKKKTDSTDKHKSWLYRSSSVISCFITPLARAYLDFFIPFNCVFLRLQIIFRRCFEFTRQFWNTGTSFPNQFSKSEAFVLKCFDFIYFLHT